MNLVDMIKDQLAGEVSKKLGNMAGLNDSDMTKTIGAGLPGLLAGLGSLASNKQGAGKLADAIGGMDSGMMGNLAGMLGGSAMQKGGGLLSGLLGGTVVDGLASAISKMTGISQGLVKTALGYLAPMVLGSVGASFKGGRVDADSISRLFAEQKQNISAAVPPGLNLNNIPGFNALSSAGSSGPARVPDSSPAASGGGLGAMLIPLLVLAALGVGIYYFLFLNGGAQKAVDAGKGAINSAQNAAQNTTNAAVEGAKGIVDGTKDALTSAIPGVDLNSLKDKLSGMMDGLGGDLGKITDAASAEAAIPGLKDSIGKLDGLTATLGALPTEGKSMVSGLVKGQLDKLNPIIEKVSAIPGLGDTFKQLIEQLKGLLAKFVG